MGRREPVGGFADAQLDLGRGSEIAHRGAYPLMKVISSSLIMSLCVVHRPCGAPLTTLSFAFLMIFAESRAESAIGTIWSSSPCRTSVGTSIFLRSSVRSVSENALMQKYEAGRPAIIPWSQKDSRTPSEILAPGLL